MVRRRRRSGAAPFRPAANRSWRSDLPWQADNEAALATWAGGLAADIRRGRWLPVMGNGDTHLAGQIGVPHTVVRAAKRSVEGMLAGLRAGRSWIADSAAVGLSVTAVADGRRAGMGQLLPTGGGPVEMWVAVRGVPGGVVSFHTAAGEVCSRSLPSSGFGTVTCHIAGPGAVFVRVEVRRPGGCMAALGNPVVLR